MAAYIEGLVRYSVPAVQEGCKAWLDQPHGALWPSLPELQALVSRHEQLPALPPPSWDAPRHPMTTEMLAQSPRLRAEFKHLLADLRDYPDRFAQASLWRAIGLEMVARAGLTEEAL